MESTTIFGETCKERPKDFMDVEFTVIQDATSTSTTSQSHDWDNLFDEQVASDMTAYVNGQIAKGEDRSHIVSSVVGWSLLAATVAGAIYYYNK